MGKGGVWREEIINKHKKAQSIAFHVCWRPNSRKLFLLAAVSPHKDLGMWETSAHNHEHAV